MDLVAPDSPAGAAKAAAGAAKAVAAGAAKAAGPKALVIANACDLLEPDERGPRVDREIAALESLGFRAEELDLRRHFPAWTGTGRVSSGGSDEPGSLSALKSGLDSASLIWARGGNAFLLLRAMRQSGFAGLLTEALAADTVVYGGYSGGIAVLPKSLRGLETVNDPVAVPEGYGYASDVPWDGLGVLDYSLAPLTNPPMPHRPASTAWSVISRPTACRIKPSGTAKC